MQTSPGFNQVYPGQAIAICSRAQAAQLVDYDHHTVRIQGRLGVLLTYPWLPLDENPGPFVLTVVFHHAEKHPAAPEAVQTLVDGLKFQFRGQAR
ncbi:MAG: hypothetical protein CVU44_00500 [Chloroflexi bacterium HGW-Chloroflexi-6]|nr:MAG: hypothetical protein CVU44_00500 [Chloroflexi bacterium HGW-Chloroflexi-6]